MQDKNIANCRQDKNIANCRQDNNKANCGQEKSIANCGQEKSSANSRQRKNKDICKKPKADHEENMKHTEDLHIQHSQRGILQGYIENENRKFSHWEKVSEHEAYKNENGREQTLSRSRQHRKLTTGGIAQVHRGREGQSEDWKEGVGGGIEK